MIIENICNMTFMFNKCMQNSLVISHKKELLCRHTLPIVAYKLLSKIQLLTRDGWRDIYDVFGLNHRTKHHRCVAVYFVYTVSC